MRTRRKVLVETELCPHDGHRVPLLQRARAARRRAYYAERMLKEDQGLITPNRPAGFRGRSLYVCQFFILASPSKQNQAPLFFRGNKCLSQTLLFGLRRSDSSSDHLASSSISSVEKQLMIEIPIQG